MKTDTAKEKQTCSVIRCMFCDIVLAGRTQFIGHMIHNHDLFYEQALEMSRPLYETRSQSLRDGPPLRTYNNNDVDIQRATPLRPGSRTYQKAPLGKLNF